MPGAQCTRSLVCEMVVQNAHEYSQRSHRKSPGIPARNGFTAYFVLSPAIGFLATVAPKKLASQELDASFEASGPHDFSVRELSALVRSASRGHRIPPQRS